MACRDDTEREDILEEVELLQAIYIHELVLEGQAGRPSSLTLLLHPSTGDDDHNLKYVCLSLCLKIPAEYPFVIPEISIQNPRGLADAHIDSIQENLFQLAKEKTGSPMLYDLIEYTKDCLSENNVPSCPCVICLEHFHEGTSFTKTNCYHYFHLLCLKKYVEHFLCENEKILCPMCRLEIEFDSNVEESECDEPDEEFVYKPDEWQHKAQIERQSILEYQRQKGGIINIKEECNKYLIGIKDMKKEASGGEENLDMNLRCGNAVAGKKVESLNYRNEEQGISRQTFKKRENRKEVQEGKNWVNKRDYQTNRNKTGGNRKEESYQSRDTKNENPEKRDRVCRRGSERNHEGQRGDKAQGNMGVASGKAENRGAFSSSRKNQQNSLNPEKSVKDFERKDKSFQFKPKCQNQLNDEPDEERKGHKRMSRDKKDCRSLVSPSSGMAGMRNAVSSKSFQTKRSVEPPSQGTCVEDSKEPNKTFRKRSSRKPRQDVKNTKKTVEMCPSNNLNSSATKSKIEKLTELPKNHSRDKEGSDVQADCPPPPGFEGLSPPPGFEGLAPPPRFEGLAPPPGFERIAPKVLL